MAYDTQGFKLLHGGLSGVGTCNIWLLDTTDAIATVNTSDYVSDGVTKGAQQAHQPPPPMRRCMSASKASARQMPQTRTPGVSSQRM